MKKHLDKILKNYIFWLVLILIFGYFVRIYKIENPIADWHSWRQADTASVSKYYVEHGINLFSPRYHDVSSVQSGIFNPQGYRFVEFPIFNAVHAILAKINLPYSFEAKGRLVSIFCSLISTVLIYLIASKRLGKFTGLLSAFFFTFIPFNIYFSRVILPEPMAVTLALASAWFYMVYIDKENSLFLYISSLSMALAMLVKPYAFFFLAAHLYLFLDKHGIAGISKPKVLIKHLLAVSLVLIPFFVWRIQINKYPAGIPFFEWAFNGDGIRFRPAFWRWIFGERLGRLILGTFGLIPFGVGLIVKNKKNLLNIALILGALAYVSVFATASVRHDYYQIFTIPAVSLICGAGAFYMATNRAFNIHISRIILLLSVSLMLGLGFYQVKDFYQVNHYEIIEAGQALDKIAPKDAWVIAPYNGDTAFLYQTGRWGWPAIDNSVENIIKQGADYYVTVTPWDNDTKDIQKKYKTIVENPKYVIVDLHQPLTK